MKNKIQMIKLAAGLLAVVLVSGCALTQAKVPLSYSAQANVPKVAGADSVTVSVMVADDRADTNSVGAKKNGFGMEMAAIVATNDVAALLKSAIETELTDRGFNLGASNAVSVVADLNTFHNDFKVGFWAGDAIAQIVMGVTVKNEAGTIIYSKIISGEGKNPNIQLASGGNAKVALDAALKDTMNKLFSDTTFIDALMKPPKP